MNTAAQGKGCSGMVAGMVAVLALVLGILMGAGGMLGFARSDAGAETLGVASAQAVECPDTPAPSDAGACPPCSEDAAAEAAPTYALVYPIEQTLRVEGKLDEERLREYVIKNRFKMQQCYQRILARDPSVKGEISLQFTASKAGQIIAAVSRHDTVGSEELKKCVLTQIRGWTFGDGAVTSDMAVVKFDVLFTPIGAGGP